MIDRNIRQTDRQTDGRTDIEADTDGVSASDCTVLWLTEQLVAYRWFVEYFGIFVNGRRVNSHSVTLTNQMTLSVWRHKPRVTGHVTHHKHAARQTTRFLYHAIYTQHHYYITVLILLAIRPTYYYYIHCATQRAVYCRRIVVAYIRSIKYELRTTDQTLAVFSLTRWHHFSMREMTSWPPFWKYYEVKWKIQVRQSMRILLLNMTAIRFETTESLLDFLWRDRPDNKNIRPICQY